MIFIKRLFCRHEYMQSGSCRSERVGNHNYVYDYEHYKCLKCNHEFTFKILRSREVNFYLRNDE